MNYIKALRKKGVKVHQPLLDENGIYAYFCEVPFLELGLAGYQRGLKLSHVANLKSRFMLKAVLPICVSLRDNQLFTFDGQHRTETMSQMGYGDHYGLVYVGLSYDEEAQLFYELNDAPSRMGGWVKFKAAYNAGNTTHRRLIQIADKHRLTTPMDPGISKVAEADIKSQIYLTWSFQKGGYPLVDAVCKALDKCWRYGNRRTPLHEDAKETAIIRGLATFLKTHYVGGGKGALPWTTIQMVLKNMGPAGLTEEAKKCKTKRVDYKQYNEALCRAFGVDPASTRAPSCHLRRAA